jgi:hypothetical protein
LDPSSSNNSPSSEDIHLDPVQPCPSTPYPQGKQELSTSRKLEDCDATTNTKSIDELDDEKHECEGCQGTHAFLTCPLEYTFDEEKQDFIPIPEGQSPLYHDTFLTKTPTKGSNPHVNDVFKWATIETTHANAATNMATVEMIVKHQ